MKKITLSLIILILLVTGCTKKNKQNVETNEFPKFVSKCYVSDTDDEGWFKYLCIEPSKQNLDDRETTNNYKFDETTNYVFDGINLKYKTLEGYYIPIYDVNKKEVERIEAPYPSYSVSEKYRKEIETINNFLNESDFNSEITLEDLNDLHTDFISKEKLLLMFNSAYNSEPTKLGKYLNLPFASITNSISNNGFYFQVGYYSEYGNIIKINIEIIYDDGTYLSDLVDEGNSSKEQEELYFTIKKIEQYILSEQDLDISKSSDYNESLKLLSNLLNRIASNYE